MQLKDTVEGMQSQDYKDRFWAEAKQLKIRLEKLRRFNNKIILHEKYGIGEPVKHDCPLELLLEQQKVMGMYLNILAMRAQIEGIEI